MMMKIIIGFLVLGCIYQGIQSFPHPAERKIVSALIQSFRLGSAQPCLLMSSALLDIASEVFTVQQLYSNSTQLIYDDLDTLVLCESIECVKSSWKALLEGIVDLGPDIESCKEAFESYGAIVEANWNSCFGD